MAIKVAVAQMNSIAGNVDANLEKVEALMRSAAHLKAQLVIVPETFTTGYDVADKLPNVADTIPGRITDRIGQLAGEQRDRREHRRVHRGKEPTGGVVDPDRPGGIVPVCAIHEQALEYRHGQQAE